MIKYLGTHNSGTSSKLVWWQRPLGFILHTTSRCQTLSIEEQLKNNVKLFNLQITRYKGEWVFSHGLCIYTEKFYDAINTMVKYATKEEPIHFQLFLDKNFLLGQDVTEFKKLVFDLDDELKDTNVCMRYAYIEGKKEYVFNNYKNQINTSEHYWTMGWAKNNARNWVDKLPLPKRHAKEFNQKYIDENKADYLMLDFIEIGNYPKPVEPTTPKPTIPTTIEDTSTPTSTPTPFVTVTPDLELVIGKQRFEFKNGYNFTIAIKNGSSKKITLNDANGYLVPNNFSINTSNNVISAKLNISNHSITIKANSVGESRLNMVAEFNDTHISGYINIIVENPSTAAPTVSTTPTTTVSATPTSTKHIETT